MKLIAAASWSHALLDCCVKDCVMHQAASEEHALRCCGVFNVSRAVFIAAAAAAAAAVLQGYCCQSGYSCTRDNSWW
jgi:hypothetical protein